MKLITLLGTILTLSSTAFANTDTANDIYGTIFQSVNQKQLQTYLQEMTGVIPVTVGGQTYSITDRYTPQSKTKYRAYLMQTLKDLGFEVQEMAYPTKHNIGEAYGHNVEGVLKGQSKDSVVIIVHYDSIGPFGQEANNPGVDDCMTGMAISLETARLLSQYKNQMKYTLRVVGSDYEEHAGPGLEGARKYAAYIKSLAQKEGFKIVAAVDNEQSGWNCASEGGCSDGSTGDTFDVFSCSGDSHHYDHPKMGDLLADTASKYSHLKVKRDCMGQNSDHYAMWEIGVPTVVYSEHNPFDNPHFDQNGGDTYDKIDQGYYFAIAQVAVTFATRLVEITP